MCSGLIYGGQIKNGFGEMEQMVIKCHKKWQRANKLDVCMEK